MNSEYQLKYNFTGMIFDFVFLALGLEKTMETSEAHGPTFKKAYFNYKRLIEKANTKPNKTSPSLNTLLKEKQENLEEYEKQLIRAVMKDHEFTIYKRLRDEREGDKLPKLQLKNRPDVKMRSEHLKLNDFVACRDFIKEIVNKNPELKDHVYIKDTAATYEFPDFFVRSKTQFVSWKQLQMRASETNSEHDAFNHFKLTKATLDYIFSLNDYALPGLEPLESPFQT